MKIKNVSLVTTAFAALLAASTASAATMMMFNVGMASSKSPAGTPVYIAANTNPTYLSVGQVDGRVATLAASATTTYIQQVTANGVPVANTQYPLPQSVIDCEKIKQDSKSAIAMFMSYNVDSKKWTMNNIVLPPECQQ